MKCPHCGVENPDNGIFCIECDKWILASIYVSPVEVEDASKEAKRPAKKANRKILLASIAAMCVVIFAIALLLPGPDNPGHITTGPFATMPPVQIPANGTVQCKSYISHTVIDGKLTFISDTQTVPTHYTASAKSVASNLDGSAAAYLADDGILLYIRDGVVTEVGKDVKNYALSASGNGLAYLTSTGGLYLFRADTGMSTQIFMDSYVTVHHYAISPDGNTVYFYNEDRRIATGYQFSNSLLLRYHAGTVSPICTMDNVSQILGVADGGQWAYVLTFGTSMLRIVNASGNVTDLGQPVILRDPTAPAFSSYSYPLPSIHMSADNCQVMYYLNDGSYLSTGGQPGVKVCDQYLTPITPALTKTILKMEYVVTYPFYGLAEKLYMSTDVMINTSSALAFTISHSVHYLDMALQPRLLIEDMDTLWLDPSGAHLYFLSDGVLARMDGTDAKNIATIAASADNFVVAPDCQTVYYLSEGTLSRYDEGGVTRIGDFQGSDVNLYMTAGQVFCYELEGSLYYENGERFAIITDCYLAPNGTLYYEIAGGAIYLLKSTMFSPLCLPDFEITTPA